MSQNVEIVRAMVTTFNRSGFLPEDLFDREVELSNIRESPLPPEQERIGRSTRPQRCPWISTPVGFGDGVARGLA